MGGSEGHRTPPTPPPSTPMLSSSVVLCALKAASFFIKVRIANSYSTVLWLEHHSIAHSYKLFIKMYTCTCVHHAKFGEGEAELTPCSGSIKDHLAC